MIRSLVECYCCWEEGSYLFEIEVGFLIIYFVYFSVFSLEGEVVLLLFRFYELEKIIIFSF